MSSIPYNYGKYVDDTVRLRDQGTVDAGKQIQSPASAGSRGLAQTTQFTNDRTQMQMGNSPIAESMVEIRNILNRIDGVNVPVQEDAGDQDDWTKLMNAVAKKYGKEKARVIHDYVQLGTDSGPELMKDYGLTPGDGMEENQREWFKKFPWLEKLDKTSWMDRLINIAGEGPDYGTPVKMDDAVQEDDMQDMTISDLEAQLGKINDEITFLQIDQKDKESALAALGELRSVLDKYQSQKESAVREDDGDERAIAAMKLARDEGGKEGFDYPQGGKYGYKAERGSGTGAMGTMQVNVTIHNRETDETMYIKDMNYLELEKGEEQETLAMIWDENRDLIQKESADSGELARLKELSGIEENAKVNFSPEQIKQLMMWNKKYSVYSGKNGDELPSGLVKANTDSGITSDGYEENEVKQYEKMFGKEEFDWDDSQHGEFQEKSKITGGMISDLEKIVGVGNADDEYTLAEIGEKILGSSFGDTYEEQYQPFPEGDEFDIEEDEDFEEVLGPLGFPEDETELFDAEYQGRKVPLNKPMRGDVKKFKVYVKDPKSGNVKKVNFGHGGTSAKRKTMRIRKSNPKARKSFRARHNCANPGPKTKARYWSCRKW